jgi:mediator of RNA polymerase II transcription subunit 7
MADQKLEASQIATTFPDPPPFWKDFTPSNLARIESLRAENGSKDGSGGRLMALPVDLLTLQPPAEPEDGLWRVFGESYTVGPPALRAALGRC